MLKLGQEVSNALAEGRPVVALESTIIAHGFPYPDNYQLALELEALLWEEGLYLQPLPSLAGSSRWAYPRKNCIIWPGQAASAKPVCAMFPCSWL